MIPLKILWQYTGMFEKCHAEADGIGWFIFDRNNDFVGFINDKGFGVNSEYKHSDKVTIELTKRGITVYDFDTAEKIKNEMEIEELLYGD